MQIKNLSTYLFKMWATVSWSVCTYFVFFFSFHHNITYLMIGVFNPNNVIKNKNELLRIKLEKILFNRIVIRHLHWFH